MNRAPLPKVEATQDDSEALADIIWFIKGRMSALDDQGRICELDVRHLEALRRFRASLHAMDEIRHRADAAEHREMLAKHFKGEALKPRRKK